MKVDILNLEWASYPSRDRNISSLVSNYLRFQGYSVIEETVFNGFEMINKYQPRLLFLANGIGAKINFQLVKYASLRGIKVVTLISEGNFPNKKEKVLQLLWGWNTDHHLYEDIHIQWSERTREMSINVDHTLINQIKVSGGCGFDVYKIKPSVNRNEFLKKYNKDSYRKVIGVGCWNFFHYCSSEYLKRNNDPEEIKLRFQKDRDLFEKTINIIIESNPTVLFILKEHPGNNLGLRMSAISGAEKYDNALILKKESIVDIITVSDFWLTYESTTVIEAWMMGKQTCLLNPTGIDFPRANVYKGSPNYPDVNSLQLAIDYYYQKGNLPGFNEDVLEKQRRQVIKDTIQWDDGLNHVRAGNCIIDVLNKDLNKKKQFVPFNIRITQLRMFLLNHLKVSRSFTYQHKKIFSHEEVCSYSRELYEMQKDYYESHHLSKETLRGINVI